MMRTTARHVIATAALFGTLASACSKAGSTERPDTPRNMAIHAAEYSFSAPDTISAGMLSVQLVNDGSEMHHVQLVRLDEGRPFEEFRAAAEGNPFPKWVTPVGGPNASSAGTDGRIVLTTTPSACLRSFRRGGIRSESRMWLASPMNWPSSDSSPGKRWMTCRPG